MIEQLELKSNILKKSAAPTLQDVATALGMHKSTVSVALSGKGTLSARTRTHILAKAREMGYEPNPLAQRLANGQRNQEVCIVAGLDMGLGTEKVLIMQRELTKKELDVPVYTCSDRTGPTSRSKAEQMRQICRQQPRAVICNAYLLSAPVVEQLKRYQANGGLVITYDFPSPLACDSVVFDREHNAYQAAKYLLKRGHREIGIAMATNVFWRAADHRDQQPDRMSGFNKALAEYGQTVRPEFVFEHGTYERGGEELARQYFALDKKPTAICIVNDHVALAFMVEVMRRGVRVPEDLSLIGHDDQPIANYCPVPLTSAVQPTEEIAQSVVDLLLNRLNGNTSAHRTIVLRGSITERASVADLTG
jgi:DNA-binding LacI/PurR family transcriptional regulator